MATVSGEISPAIRVLNAQSWITTSTNTLELNNLRTIKLQVLPIYGLSDKMQEA